MSLRYLALLFAGLPVLCAAAAEDPIRVGSKRFTESYILGEIIKQSLEAHGAVQVEHRQGLGSTAIVFEALKSGAIDAYADYSGTINSEILHSEQTLTLAPELKKLGVEFIEQPLPAGDWAGFKKLFTASALPIIADESCLVPEDVDRCAGYFHGINVKLTKAGGLTPGRRMLQRARELGLKTMVGCMCESSVGISAIAQLLPLLDYVDMDGAVLIARDIATGVRVEKGRVIFPAENGNGVQLLPDLA